MKFLGFAVVVYMLCVPGVFGGEVSSDGPPVAVFADLDGAWEGTFVGWDETGRELYRISVRQHYRTVDDEHQEVQIVDTMPDGTVIRGQGFNIARREADGSLSLRCVVEKSNGDRVEHLGRLGTGPDGEPQLTWYSDAPGRSEVFREVVRREGDSAVYTIDGVGRYGDSTIVMAGRYHRVSVE